MMTITVYSKSNCQYCDKAKNLLSKLGLSYEEKKLEEFASTEAMLKDIGKMSKLCLKLKLMDN